MDVDFVEEFGLFCNVPTAKEARAFVGAELFFAYEWLRQLTLPETLRVCYFLSASSF